MAEVVDSIIADLQVRYQQYVDGFDKATAENRRFIKSVEDMKKLGLVAVPDQYAGQISKAAAGADAHERATERVKRTRKARTDAVASAAKAETDAEKAASAERIRIAEAEDARIKAIVDRAAARATSGRRTSGTVGPSLPRENINTGTGAQAFIDGETAGEVVAAKELNLLALDLYDKRQRAAVAEGENLVILKAEVSELARAAFYRRQGLTDEQAAIRAQAEELAIAKLRTEQAVKQSVGQSGLRQAVGAAAFGYSPSGGALVGLAAAGAVVGGAEIVKSAAEYGRQLQATSRDLGVSTTALQVYQFAAKQAGATNEVLASSFGQLQSNLGKAKTGSEEQAKAFKALGINAKDFATVGDLLPTLIDRFSKISDPATRASIGTRLFGEEYRKLDPIIAGGNQKIADLTKRLTDMGAVLSDGKIDKLAAASVTLGELNDKLKVDLANVVSDNQKAILGLAGALGTLSGQIIQFLNSHPEEAFALIGALAGSRFGVAGAAIGAAGGAFAGEKIANAQDDGNTDVAFRRQKLLAAYHELKDREASFSGAAPAGSDSYLGGLVTVRHGESPRSGATVEQAKDELRRQQGLYRQSVAAAKPQGPPPVKPGDPNQALIDLLGKAKGKSAETLAAEAAARTKSYNDRLAAFQEADLRAQESLTGDIDKRAGIEKQLADRALKKLIGDPATGQKGDIELQKEGNIARGANAKLEEARARTLTAAAIEANATEKAAIDVQTRADHEHALTAHALTQLTIQDDLLNSSLALAKTAKERSRLALEILANEKETERRRLQDEIKTALPGSEAAKDAQAKLDSLDKSYVAKGKVIAKQNQSPGEAYRDSLVSTADDVNEAFQRAEVKGLQSFNDGLTTSISRMLHLHGIAGQFLEDLIKIGLEKELVAPIANALFGASSGGGGGGLFGSLLSAIGLGGGGDLTSAVSAGSSFGADASLFSDLSVLGFASGGVMDIGGHGGIDRNLVSINGQPVARVSQGEKMAIIPAGIGAAGPNVSAPSGGGVTLHQTVNIDASGVNPEGYTKGLLGIVRQETAQALQTNNANNRRAFPSVQARFNKLGTTG
jgi:hypothetical protein